MNRRPQFIKKTDYILRLQGTAIKSEGIVTISPFGYFKVKNIKKVVIVVETSPQRPHFYVAEKSYSFRYELDALLIVQIKSGGPGS